MNAEDPLIERIAFVDHDGTKKKGDVVVVCEGPAFLTCKGMATMPNGQMHSFTWVIDKKNITSRYPVPVKIMKKTSLGV